MNYIYKNYVTFSIKSTVNFKTDTNKLKKNICYNILKHLTLLCLNLIIYNLFILFSILTFFCKYCVYLRERNELK